MSSKLSLLQKIVLEKATAVIYISSVDEKLCKEYTYLAVRADKLSLLKQALDLPECDLSKYGNILLQGRGIPSQEVIEYMQKEFGCNHNDAIPFTN